MDSGNIIHGFLRTPDGTITSFDPPQSVSTYAFAINSKNVITGYYVDGSGQHGFVHDAAGTITKFDVACQNYTTATGINNNGTIVGKYRSIHYRAKYNGFVRMADGTITTFSGGHLGLSDAPAINDTGAVAGDFIKNESGSTIGFERSPDGTVTHFRAPRCHQEIHVNVISSTGAIAGACGADGFLRAEDGTFTFLKDGVDTAATGMNSSNTIVGWVFPKDGVTVGFLRTTDGTVSKIRIPGAAATVPAA